METECQYYETLGLSRDASPSEITRAYQILEKMHHPDASSHPKAQKNFRKIHEAYAVLSDAERKEAYDTSLNTPGQNRESENEGICFEHEFYVQNESFNNEGGNFVVDHVHHLIINGEEFLECNGELFTYERDRIPFDLHDIEAEYYTTNETITIDGVDYRFENAHHIVINGREYIEYDGDYIPFNRPGYPEHTDNNREKPHPVWNTRTMLVKLVIIFVVVFTATHGILMIKSSANTDLSPGSLIRILSALNIPSQEKEWALQIRDAMDAQHPTTRDYALSLIDKSHTGERNIAQLCDIWEKTHKKWTYVSDPKGLEYFSPASNTIELGLKGDCDDFAILIASLVEATGGDARVIMAEGADGGGHVYAEVFVTDNKQDFESISQYISDRYNCRTVAYRIVSDENKEPHYWLNLDGQSHHPGGEFYDSNGKLTAYNSNGQYHRLRSNT
ncbi:DnaJ domain-containing protein [Methanogenium sp. MK-MG]|uniref:DnaJ domain-containing protein n=1 Tax=Methanogenium sp. MK-MG TaxID=2599926 RepID=UPI0013EE18D3|nr:DnaJ domain-containing protein [Methanogenium sp. MK-MG]KAF1078441.1 Chaperone protein DnaJ [Methanogenium sp. MK-MG]